MKTIATSGLMAVYNKLKAALKAQGWSGQAMPARLRVEVYTANGNTDYALQIKDSTPRLSAANTEVKLKDQDLFLFGAFRMGIAKEIIAGPLGIEELHLFPNFTAFADEGAGANDLKNAHLHALWNGLLNIKVGDTVYLDDFPVQDCYSAMTTQQTGTVKSERIRDVGFVEFKRKFAIKGMENNDIRFKMPNANANQRIQYAATNKLKVVFEFDGIKFTGAGITQYKLDYSAAAGY